MAEIELRGDPGGFSRPVMPTTVAVLGYQAKGPTMKAIRVLWAALALAALAAPGCEEPAEVSSSSVKPQQSELATANAEIARLKQDNAGLRAQVSELQTKLTATEGSLRQSNARLRKQEGDAARAAAAATAAISKLKADNARLSADAQGTKGRITKLEDSLKKASATNQQLTGQLQQAQKLIADLRKQGLADQQQAKKAADQTARMAKVVEALRQEVVKRDRRISGLEMRLTGKTPVKPEPPPVWPNGTPAVEPAQPPKHVKVETRLTQVRADQGRIDAGSAMGVYRGMRMAVYRDAKFMAFFLVADVDLKSAGGFILGRKADPKAGDKVISLPPKRPTKKVSR